MCGLALARPVPSWFCLVSQEGSQWCESCRDCVKLLGLLDAAQRGDGSGQSAGKRPAAASSLEAATWRVLYSQDEGRAWSFDDGSTCSTCACVRAPVRAPTRLRIRSRSIGPRSPGRPDRPADRSCAQVACKRDRLPLRRPWPSSRQAFDFHSLLAERNDIWRA